MKPICSTCQQPMDEKLIIRCKPQPDGTQRLLCIPCYKIEADAAGMHGGFASTQLNHLAN